MYCPQRFGWDKEGLEPNLNKEIHAIIIESKILLFIKMYNFFIKIKKN